MDGSITELIVEEPGNSVDPAAENGGEREKAAASVEELVAKAIDPVKREYLLPPPIRTSIKDPPNDAVSGTKSSPQPPPPHLLKEKKSKRQIKRERRQMKNHGPPMYFSLLLSQDFSLDDPNLLDEFSIQTDVPIQTHENESNKRTGRKENFTIDEDVLVSGWLNLRMNPIQGNDQKHGRYWERVHEYFHEYKIFESERNSTALVKRWSIIQLAVNKFCGYYVSIERMQQSGVGEHDKICQALEMFKNIQKQPFGFMHCWRLLKDVLKWRTDNSGKKQKNTRKSSPATSSLSTVEEVSLDEDDGIEDTISAGLERPMGRKASKAQDKKGKGTGDTSTPMELRFEKFEHQMKLNQQKRQENMDKIYFQEQEKLNIMKAQEDERIMMIDTTNMEPELAEYYKQRKKEIMKKVTSSS